MNTPVRAIASLLALAPLAISACATLDTTHERTQLATTINDRTGILPEDWLHASSTDQLPSQLTSREAARLALTHNPRLRASLERIAAARADLVQAGLLPNPILSVDLGFHIGGPAGSTQVGVGLVEQLTSILSRSDRQSSADSALRAEVLAVSDLALSTVAAARAAHARLLYAQAALAPMREAVTMAEHAVETTRKRVQAGEESSLEVNRQKLLLARLNSELAQRETDLELRKRELLAKIGLADRPANFTAIEEGGMGLPAHASAPDLADEQAAITAARTQRLDVVAASALAESALANINAQRKSRFDLGAGASFARTDDKRRELGPSITVGIPIFDTGEARVARARADADRLMFEFCQTEQSAIAEARAAWITARSARILAHRYESEVAPLSETNLSLAQRSFTAGQTDLTVLLETQQASIESKLKLIELKERAGLAEIELRRSVGR